MAKEKAPRLSRQEKAAERKEKKERLAEAKAAEKQRKKDRAAQEKQEKAAKRQEKAARRKETTENRTKKSAERRELAAERKEKRNRSSRKHGSSRRRQRVSAAAMYEDDSLRKKQKQLSYPELSHFCEQMSMILKAGISSLEGIEMMESDYSSKRDRDIMIDIRQEMEETGDLAASMAKTGVFPDYMIRMIRLGEESGSLDDVMDSLDTHYTREEQLRSSIQSAVFYPLIMSAMIVVVIIVLLVRVMPIFNQVFKQLGTEMTGLAAALVNFGDLITRYSVVIALILAALLLFAIFCVKTKAGRSVSRAFLRQFKSFRILNDQIATCRFADGMALVLKSGLDPTKGFNMVYALNEDREFRKKLDICSRRLNGNPPEGIAEAIEHAGIFDGVYSRMISIGSKTGSFDAAMDQIATLYQDTIDTTISNKLAILEPTLIVVLSMVVGAILVSVMFPLLSIMATI